jgi:glutathione S-transferase
MLKFYFSGAPNPTKVALFLEEAGIPYEAIPVDTRKGEQHKPDYLAINPNAKVPAIIDGEVTVFDSNAILLYLGEKTGKFMPPAGDRADGRAVLELAGIGCRAEIDEQMALAVDGERMHRMIAGERQSRDNDLRIFLRRDAVGRQRIADDLVVLFSVRPFL